MRSLITLTACLLLTGSLFSQFNFKSGYRMGFTDPVEFNTIVSNHNTRYSTVDSSYSSPFGELRYLHRADFGLRYRIDNVSFEVGWIYSRKELLAEGELGNNDFRNAITTTFNTGSASIYTHVGAFSLGASLDLNGMKINGKFEEFRKPFKVKDSAWSSHFTLAYNFRSRGQIWVSIQPYIQLYWTDYDLTEFNLDLNGPLEPVPVITDKFNTIGIAFVIFNGEPLRR